MRSLYPWPLFPPDLEPPAARSLSLQLALQEWICSYDLIEALEKKPPRIIPPEQFLQELETLSKELQKLLLFSIESPFSQKPGTLDKLCFYSDELLQASHIIDREPIGHLLNHMRDALLNFRTRLSSWRRKIPSSSVLSYDIEQLCRILSQRLTEFYEALYPFFEEARSDENVLFYLIEQKDSLNRHLHPKKVEHLLARLYPSGPTHLRAILCEGYTRRGFSAFYARHEALIDSIDWTTTDECLPTLTMS